MYNLEYEDRQSFLSKARLKLLKNKTYYEKKVAEMLTDLGVDFIEQKGFLVGFETSAIVDFYLPKPNKVVIEIDGSQHYTPEGKAKDAKRDKCLESRGFKVLRFSNHDVYERLGWVREQVKKVLK